MRTRGLKPKVLTAILDASCVTSWDVAEEVGVSVKDASKCVSALVSLGALRWTDQTHITPYGKIRKFEVVR